MNNNQFLNKAYWLKYLGIKPKEVPDSIIIYGSWFFDKTLNYLEKYTTSKKTTTLPNFFIGKIDNQAIGYSVVYGSTMAAEIAHIACVIGIKKIIFIGSYLDLSNNKNIIMIPNKAVSAEGVMEWYSNKKSFNCSKDLENKIKKQFIEKNILPNTGSIKTLSFMLMENKKSFKKDINQKVNGLDLETAAIYGVAEFFKIKAIAILIKSEQYHKDKINYISQAEKLKAKNNLFALLPSLLK